VVGELRILRAGLRSAVCGSAVSPAVSRVASVPGCGGRSRQFVRFEDVSHERGRYRPVRDKVTAAIPPPRYGALGCVDPLLFRVSRFDPFRATRPGVRVALLAERPPQAPACARSTTGSRAPHGSSGWGVAHGIGHDVAEACTLRTPLPPHAVRGDRWSADELTHTGGEPYGQAHPRGVMRVADGARMIRSWPCHMTYGTPRPRAAG
jgi:hypothetical protein